MIEHPFTQDIRASLTLLITDDVETNNRVISPGDPERGIPPTYAQWDDTIEGVRFNMFRDPDEFYMYVPVGTRTTEQRLIDEEFITDWLRGKRVIMINDYHLMTLDERTKHWSYQDLGSFERKEVVNIQPTWRGYNMVSRWYWLSDEEMLDGPEYIECASWSLEKPKIQELSDRAIIMLGPEATEPLEALLG